MDRNTFLAGMQGRVGAGSEDLRVCFLVVGLVVKNLNWSCAVHDLAPTFYFGFYWLKEEK